jgi:serine/threonine-protein kinase
VPLERATTIAHPRLLKLLGSTRIGREAYLVSEYVDGLSVASLTQALQAAETSVVPEVALRIALDALLAVSALREELRRFGVKQVERCLYPDSIWVACFGETLLSDAGLAHELFRRAAQPSQRAFHVPEEAQTGASDERSDVFAAGAVLWELLSGRRLPPEQEFQALPRFDQVEPMLQCPPELLALVERALNLDPELRFQNADELVSAIRSLPTNWIASDAEVRVTVEALTHQASEIEGPETQDLASGEHEIDAWDGPTRSLRARHLGAVDDGVTLRPPAGVTSTKPAG